MQAGILLAPCVFLESFQLESQSGAVLLHAVVLKNCSSSTQYSQSTTMGPDVHVLAYTVTASFACPILRPARLSILYEKHTTTISLSKKGC